MYSTLGLLKAASPAGAAQKDSRQSTSRYSHSATTHICQPLRLDSDELSSTCHHLHPAVVEAKTRTGSEQGKKGMDELMDAKVGAGLGKLIYLDLPTRPCQVCLGYAPPTDPNLAECLPSDGLTVPRISTIVSFLSAT
jgi:hypothetical protein